MFNNKKPVVKKEIAKKEKINTISFDTLATPTGKVEFPSMFNVSNKLYSMPEYLEKTLNNATPLDIVIRRATLTEMFKQRVFFLLEQAIRVFTFKVKEFNTINGDEDNYLVYNDRWFSAPWGIIQKMEEKFPEIFDVQNYMINGQLTIVSFSDIANMICIFAYKEAVSCYENAEHAKKDAETLSGFLAELFTNVVGALQLAEREAKTIYSAAGYPDIHVIGCPHTGMEMLTTEEFDTLISESENE